MYFFYWLYVSTIRVVNKDNDYEVDFAPPLKLRPYGGIEVCVLLLLLLYYYYYYWINNYDCRRTTRCWGCRARRRLKRRVYRITTVYTSDLDLMTDLSSLSRATTMSVNGWPPTAPLLLRLSHPVTRHQPSDGAAVAGKLPYVGRSLLFFFNYSSKGWCVQFVTKHAQCAWNVQVNT